MTSIAERVYEQALDLPLDARLALIDKLLKSTNLPTREDIDQAWSKEIESRFQQLESGQTKLVPGEEVFEKIRKRLAG